MTKKKPNFKPGQAEKVSRKPKKTYKSMSLDLFCVYCGCEIKESDNGLCVAHKSKQAKRL
jgi:hypothetical protein